ncbi:hypothetical protein IAU60_000184 [Kwoniella sp. DSM 27419]
MDSLRVARIDNVQLDLAKPPTSADSSPTQRLRTGTLHLTPHHLIFSDTPGSSSTAGPSSSSSSATEPEIWIPYPAITLLTRLPQTLQGLYPVRVETRYFDNYVFSFQKDREGGAEDVWQSVKDCAVKSSVEQLYAFFYHDPHSSSTPSSNRTGWNVYSPRAEFTRQGLGTRTKAWRFTDINRDYSFSPTYPAKLAVPSRISDSTLTYAAKYRSKGRIPALTYLHWANSSSITRSSQPMVGLKNSRSAQDERLVECIFSSHAFLDPAYAAPVYGATTTNLIIDARPTTNAMANVAMGAGTENMENYKLGKKAYLGIDNIHVMRNSLKVISEAIRDAESRSAVLDRSLLLKSNWLRHISTILDGALMIVRNVHLNASHVLIHCSDGWDRTAQLSAVAQLSLDPYFRTIEGLSVLIEKDFSSFGHKFLDRSGHLSSNKYFVETEVEEDSDEEGVGASRAAQAFFASVQKQFSNNSTSHLKETSPVFHQFLDCVRQIQRQYPERFEFNEQLLLDLYYHLYSCQFGTFLFNNERERLTATPPRTERTASIWNYVQANRQKYLNETYDASLDKSRDDQGVLLFDSKDVKFWFKLFRRGDEEMNGSALTLAQAQGAEVTGPIGGAQEDPITPNPAIASIARAISPPASGSAGRERTEGTPVRRGESSRSGGWGWGQISSGAFSAVTSAAREIKSISQDAIAQLKAEANEVDGDWRKGSSAQADQMGSGGVTSGSQPTYRPYTKQAIRVPSEANPWGGDTLPRQGQFGARVNGDEPVPSAFPSAGPPRPTGQRIPSQGTANPWTTSKPPSFRALVVTPPERTISPALGALSLGDDDKAGARARDAQGDPRGHTMRGATSITDDDLVRAAMGDDKKAWDPLGAL